MRKCAWVLVCVTYVAVVSNFSVEIKIEWHALYGSSFSNSGAFPQHHPHGRPAEEETNAERVGVARDAHQHEARPGPRH